jgi:ribosome modulation factor
MNSSAIIEVEQEGRQAYEGGMKRSMCPYALSLPGKRYSWISGWDRGRREREPWPIGPTLARMGLDSRA